MKTIKLILLLSLFVIFGNCTSRKTLASKKCRPPEWCETIRDISNKSWKYAQLSKNVYNKNFQFNLDKYFEKLEDFEYKDIDFFATLYKDRFTGEYILAFRGTDSFEDFLTGNNPFKQDQNKCGLDIFDACKAKYNFKQCIVTGHSLGGGIATHISLNKENVTAYTFNRSPVFRNIKNIKNVRYTIVETGDILGIPRLLGPEPMQSYIPIDCANGWPVKQHDMKNLAKCLTQIAAINNNEAKESLILNHFSSE